ncbi:MAG: hybrid sensor histidine kinase/response regulator [SAR324 cluster bacterium]|nr:hybrid sensor histidine kinase/response regulator [SAR324 cluster bacterium]
MKKHYNILIIDDNFDNAGRIRALLGDASAANIVLPMDITPNVHWQRNHTEFWSPPDMVVEQVYTLMIQRSFSITHVTNLLDGLEKMFLEHYDAVLLSIALPETEILQIFSEDSLLFFETPLLVCSPVDDPILATQVLTYGAQEFVVINEVTSRGLVRSLLFSIDRFNNALRYRQAEEKSRKYAEKLQEMNSSKDKFFSIISHDLRSPLGSIINLAQVALKNSDTLNRQDMTEILNLINNSVLNLSDLLNNLLNWAMVQSNRIVPLPRVISLKQIVSDILESLRGNTENKELNVAVNIPENLRVYADQTMIHSVLQNLISNATKFTPRQGSIIINATTIANHAEVSVSDSGIGISEEDLKKLFKIDAKYFRNGTDGEKGTGLGLIICKEMVEKNNGRIWCESQLNQGTTFTITIPLREPTESTSIS